MRAARKARRGQRRGEGRLEVGLKAGSSDSMAALHTCRSEGCSVSSMVEDESTGID